MSLSLILSALRPAGDGTVVAAAQWIQGVLTGTAANSLAVLAIAGVGFGLLSGRIDLRRAAQVVIGCFILFGAPAIVAELTTLVRANGGEAAGPLTEPAGALPPAPPAPPPPDPYAGAAVPM